MERDGVVRRVGRRPGTTRPSRIFELTPEVEQLLSRAYVPLLTQLVDVFANSLPAHQVDALLREVGRKLARELSSGRPSGTLRSRVIAASERLNEQLGAVTHVEANGGYIIRGEGCPLSALTGKHPSVCRAMESLVKELAGASVHECCERAQRPRCCCEVARAVTGPARPSRAWIGFDGVFEVKVPACTSSVEPTFTMERTRTQPNSRTLAQSPWTFSSAPAAGVSNSTREASVKSRPSLSFLYAIPPRSYKTTIPGDCRG
jgi:predicted ArsR family transcriptional regulator